MLTQSDAFAAPKPVAAAASVAMRRAAFQAYSDFVTRSLHFQQGRVVLPGSLGELTGPRGLRCLDSAQRRRALTQLRGNPKSETLGMLFPANRGPLDAKPWAHFISYDAVGYVKDDAADDINYSELLTEMQADTEGNNKERSASGFEPFDVLD